MPDKHDESQEAPQSYHLPRFTSAWMEIQNDPVYKRLEGRQQNCVYAVISELTMKQPLDYWSNKNLKNLGKMLKILPGTILEDIPLLRQIIGGFIRIRLLEGNMITSARAKEYLGEGIDLDALFPEEEYVAIFRENFLTILRDGRIAEAAYVQEKMGGNIDLETLEEYETTVLETFDAINRRMGSYGATGVAKKLIELKQRFGKNIDFMEKQTACRQLFELLVLLAELDEMESVEALCKAYENETWPFNKIIKTVLRMELTGGRISNAKTVAKHFNLEEDEESRETIERTYGLQIRYWDIERAFQIKTAFPSAAAAEEMHEGFPWALEKCFEGDPRMRHSPESSENPFRVSPGEAIRPAQLFHTRLLMMYFVNLFQKQLRAKIVELGSPTGDPTELTEEKQAKLQAFAANLHAELSAKIRAITSPELIAAYLEQNAGGTGSEFLTQAA